MHFKRSEYKMYFKYYLCSCGRMLVSNYYNGVVEVGIDRDIELTYSYTLFGR